MAQPTRRKQANAKTLAHKVRVSKSVPAEVAAAIALALRDQAASEARDRELREPPSPWTLAARASLMHARWTR